VNPHNTKIGGLEIIAPAPSPSLGFASGFCPPTSAVEVDVEADEPVEELPPAVGAGITDWVPIPFAHGYCAGVIVCALAV